MTNPVGTDLDADEYIASLVVADDDSVSQVTHLDGATIFRITDEHFVIVTCECGETRHKGLVLLERTFPQDWICFARVTNLAEKFGVYHYGPSFTDKT